MFKLVHSSRPPTTTRLISLEKLDAADFAELARQMGVSPTRARKTGFVSARRALKEEQVTTLWNGKETTAMAQPGDMVVANLTPDRKVMRDAGGHANIYVILAAKFPDLYETDTGATEYGTVYRARGVVDAIFMSGGFEILAPWGEIQRADTGYIVKNGEEVYGNHKDTFEKTYVTDA
jgi:hypothetical protein